MLEPRAATLGAADSGLFGEVVAAAFGQRRKMLRSALGGLFSRPDAALERCGIGRSARAEELEVEAFSALARALEDERAAV